MVIIIIILRCLVSLQIEFEQPKCKSGPKWLNTKHSRRPGKFTACVQ